MNREIPDRLLKRSALMIADSSGKTVSLFMRTMNKETNDLLYRAAESDLIEGHSFKALRTRRLFALWYLLIGLAAPKRGKLIVENITRSSFVSALADPFTSREMHYSTLNNYFARLRKHGFIYSRQPALKGKRIYSRAAITILLK